MAENFENNYCDKYTKTLIASLELAKNYDISLNCTPNVHLQIPDISIISASGSNTFDSNSFYDEDKVFLKNSSFKKNSSTIDGMQKQYSELILEKYQNLFEVYHAINLMYWKDNEKDNFLQSQNQIIHQQNIEDALVIIDPSVLNSKFMKIQQMMIHLEKIISSVDMLKNKLKSPALKDVWKIHPDYHQHVINFFDNATILIKEIEENITSLEWIQETNHQSKINPVLEAIRKPLLEFHHNVDVIKEFRKILVPPLVDIS